MEERSSIFGRLYRKIATLLCMSLLLQLTTPVMDVFADEDDSSSGGGQYTSSEVETHNTAKKKLGSYTTSGYVITTKDGVEVTVPVHKETQVDGDKTYTENSLDWEWLKANQGKFGYEMSEFIDEKTGQYKFEAEIEYEIVISTNPLETTKVHGKQALLDAPQDYWGGYWSTTTRKNIEDEKNSIAEGTYYYPTPTPTPTPSPTPLPKYNYALFAVPQHAGSISGAAGWYTANTEVKNTVNTTANPGWELDRIEGPTGNFTITDHTYTIAYFISATPTPTPIPTYKYTIVGTPSEGGTVWGSGTYKEGDWVNCGYTVNEGWEVCYTGGPVSPFEMPGDTVTAVVQFKKKELPPPPTPVPATPVPPTPVPTNIPSYTFDIYGFPEEGGTVYGSGTYMEGATVNAGYFVNEGWSVSNISGPIGNFAMPAENIVTIVTFVKDPTPLPTSTPTPEPTPTPAVYHFYPYEEYIEYGTTSNGYSVSDPTRWIANANGAKQNALSLEIEKVGTKTAYDIGVDDNGNEWYCIKNDKKIRVPGVSSSTYFTGYTATYVHPKTYNGYDVNSPEVQYITDLVFPEYIKIAGSSRKYYVYTIGGSGAYYYGEPATTPAGTRESNLGKIKGNYSSGTNAFSYELGVIGNGTITSSGNKLVRYEDYDIYYLHYNYQHDYYIYNTTLRTVTIPAGCVTVDDYAFRNCQALMEITLSPGMSLETIGTHAFSVSEIPKLQRSNSSSKYMGYYSNVLPAFLDYKTIYSYDNSYVTEYKTPFTDDMYTFQYRLKLYPQMEGPWFPHLITIGESAFENRYHLSKITLSNTVTTIHQNAFKNCKLESISVPKVACVVEGDYHTLGTKGSDYAMKTIIITGTNSKAHAYGVKYGDYYMLSPNVNITYVANGGTPNNAQTLPAAAEYMQAKCGDQMVSNGDYVVWLDDEYKVYSAKINGSKISGTAQNNLTTLKFTKLRYEEGFGFIATTENGVEYILTVSSSGITVAHLPAAILEETVYVGSSIANSYIRRVLPDYREQVIYKNTVYTETAFPAEVLCSQLTTSKAASSNSPTVYQHKIILCTDGKAYMKEYLTSAWMEIPLPSGATKWTGLVTDRNGTTTYLVADNTRSGYAVEARVYGSNNRYVSTSTISLYPRAVTTTLQDLAVALNTENTKATNVSFYTGSESTTNANYDSDGNWIDTSSSYMSTEWHFTYSDSGVGLTYSRYEQSSDYSSDELYFSATLATNPGTYMGAIADSSPSSSESFSAVFFKDGYLAAVVASGQSNPPYNNGTCSLSETRLSDIQFKKCVLLSDSAVYTSNGYSNESSNRYGYPETKTHTGDRSIIKRGSYDYTNGALYLVGLGMDGHLYCIEYSNASKSFYTTVTKYDDNIYTDIVHEAVTQTSEDDDWDSNVPECSYKYDLESRSTSYWDTTVTSHLYALRDDNRIYHFSQIIYDSSDETEYESYYSCNCTDSSKGNHTTTSSSTTSSYYEYLYNIENFILTLMDYVNVSHNHEECDGTCVPNNVDKLLEYPYFQFAPGEVGYYPNLSTPLDINAGVVAHYDISPNLWFTKTGYECNRWNTKANGTGTTYLPNKRYDSNTTVTNLTLYAQWEGETPDPMYVYYDANGGIGTMNTSVIPVGSNSFTVQANAFTKNGNDFAGYFTEHPDGYGTKYYPGQAYTTDRDMILYAQWKPYTYTVSFAFDDIRMQPATIWDTIEDITFDQVIGMPEEPYEKKCVVDYDLNTNYSMSTAASAKWETPYPFSEDYTTVYMKFLGWHKYRNKADGTYQDLYWRYAEFEEVSGLSNIKNDKLTMFPEWGGVESYVCLPYASCNGYELYGYMDARTEEDATELIDYVYENGGGLYLPKMNETLYVRLVPREYLIDLDSSNEGTPADFTGDTEVLMTFDAVCPDIIAPTLEHMVFMGYFDENGVQYYGPADKTTGKASAYGGKLWQIYDGSVTTLYAKWVPDKYVVRLDDRGATSTGHTNEVTMSTDKHGPDILVPEKTGYTFHGYFTEIRGAGTQYYSTDGICVKPWTEKDVDVLYAYWIQNPVILPEEDDYTEPEVPEQTEQEGSIGRKDARGLLYADDYNDATGALDDLQPYLTYDTPGSEGVIPGTENLSFRARMGSWMLYYKFQRNSGTDMVKYIVTVPYRIQYESEDETLVISERRIDEYSFMVPKAWSYWEVVESGMYYPDEVTVINEALTEESITVKVDREGKNAVKVPEYSVINYGGKEEHVHWETYDEQGLPVFYLELEEQYIISNKATIFPDVSHYLSTVCKNAAWADEREAKVRSDRYEFDKVVILSDEWLYKNGAELMESGLPADEEQIELTSYLQTYLSGISMNDSKPNGKYATSAKITYVGDEANIGVDATKVIVLKDINALRIHTPVACDGRMVQGIESGILTLKDALNYFTVAVDNTGNHRMSLGYGEKNFAVALSGKSNIAEENGEYLNQVQFPFDVYTEGDVFVKAGTWKSIGDSEKTFYIPVTQKNGTYRIKFRTIAVNCPKTEDVLPDYVTQEKVNTEMKNYVAADSMEVEIRSYLRDFIIVGTQDPSAQEKLEKGMQALTLKKGYDFFYDLLTQGEFFGNKTELIVTPEFFWVSEDESERQKAELYYADYLTEKEKRTCYPWDNVPLLERHENHEVIVQRFSGKGRIPAEVLCVTEDMQQIYGFSVEEYTKKQTITGREAFFKQNGYLVINFDIKIKSEEGIWYTFSDWENTKLYQDWMAAGWNYVPGDIIRYDLSKSIADDYEIGGIE